MESALERILLLEKERDAACKKLLAECEHFPMDRKAIKAAAKYYNKTNKEYTKAYSKYRKEHK